MSLGYLADVTKKYVNACQSKINNDLTIITHLSNANSAQIKKCIFNHAINLKYGCCSQWAIKYGVVIVKIA